MPRTAPYYFKLGSLILFIFILIGYATYQARGILFGPQVTVTSPINGETYTNPDLTVKGTVTNSTYFAIDDHPVLTDKHGDFNEQLLLSPGYNIIKVEAEDRFGKKKELLFQVILTPLQEVEPMPVTASTTATTTP